MPRRPARTTQADIARAIRAAQAAGGGWAIELLPDGTLRLVPQRESSEKDTATLAEKRRPRL